MEELFDALSTRRNPTISLPKFTALLTGSHGWDSEKLPSSLKWLFWPSPCPPFLSARMTKHTRLQQSVSPKLVRVNENCTKQQQHVRGFRKYRSQHVIHKAKERDPRIAMATPTLAPNLCLWTRDESPPRDVEGEDFFELGVSEGVGGDVLDAEAFFASPPSWVSL
mmetsp:Transcript_28155/g.54754  ORF Transcript_28155/g.54754 Transcript_28155/m.54754 type:complete len:166 (-) Transcript_28155:777-1274(-)